MITAAAVCGAVNAEVLWQADLTSQLGGFQVQKMAEDDKASAANGELRVSFSKGKIARTALIREIPFPDKGELTFDMMLNSNNSQKEKHWSLRLMLFGNMSGWNGSTGAVRGFYAYPKGWVKLANPKVGAWVPVKIAWDKTKKTITYYIGDLYSPIKTFENTVFKETSAGKGLFEITNYGYAPGPVEHKFRNIKVSSGDSALENDGVIWQENFAEDGTLEENGFRRVMDNKKDRFTVKDGVLTMACENSPYKGTMYQKEIPVTAKCEFSFEAKIAAAGSGLYNHLALRIYFGNVLIAFKDPIWGIHHPSKNTWIQPSKVTNNQWHTFKIRFDAVKRTAEFYMDDMENPVCIDNASEYDPSAGNLLQIGNYGLSSGMIINCLRNMKITLIKESDQKKTTSLKGTMLFNGVSAEYWPVKQIAAKFGDPEMTVFNLAHGAHHGSNGPNVYDLQPKPPVRPKALPKCIILADMPLAPVPDYARKMIIESVEAGANLVILNGFFTLNKGRYRGSELEKLLPVTVDDPWGTVQVKAASKTLNENGKPAVAYHQYGKGKVFVTLERPVDPVTESVLFAAAL